MSRSLSLAIALSLIATSVADAKPRKKKRKATAAARIETPADLADTPAIRYAALTSDECLAELDRREVPYERETARGVKTAVRLTGPLRGVTYRTNLKDAARATTAWEIADCALVLALDDLAEILVRHDVVEVRHYSMYRAPRGAWPEGKIAKQHNGAVAIDPGRFVRTDGRILDVDDHFSGRIGAKTCGDGAKPRKPTPESLALRAILCDAVAARLFNVVLTPNYNRAHKNHFHLEVTSGVQWFMVD